jgi:hypothetical protein
VVEINTWSPDGNLVTIIIIISSNVAVVCTDWKLVQSDARQDVSGYIDDYDTQFRNSTFCIAATGSGFGVRAKLAVMNGCIPVIIADAIQVFVPLPLCLCVSPT